MIRKLLRRLGTIGRSAGFTMIELLVVISIIGILAVAVLSALNPIEQINKGRDTRLRSDAGELLSANERYFSIHEVYPWNETRTGAEATPNQPYTPASAVFSTALTFDGTLDPQNAGGTWNWLYQLADTQEVKPAFVQRLINDSQLIVLRGAGTNSSIYVCYTPQSYAFQLEAAKNCLNGSTQVSINAFTLCSTTDGSIPVAPAVNYMCLP